MKKLLTLAVAALAVLAFTAPAFAVGTPQPGDLGIFFDAAGTQTSRAVAPFVGFNIYVVSFEVPGGILAYEFALQMPAGLIVSAGRTFVGNLDVGSGDDNWICGTGGVCYGEVGPLALVTYNAVLALAAVPANTPICLTGATPTSFPQNNLPGYLYCHEEGRLENFGAAYAGCATINGEGPIPAETQSWGSMKANF